MTTPGIDCRCYGMGCFLGAVLAGLLWAGILGLAWLVWWLA